MARHVFVNLPVIDLERSVDFFTRLGFEFDAKFTDKNATCMIINDSAFVMLLTDEFFQTFTSKQLSDSTAETEAIIAVSVDSREQVDSMADAALAAGGLPSNEPTDQGFMYSRSFQDPDGHLWEVLHMDHAAAR